MLDILRKFNFFRSLFEEDDSAKKAKERLRLVLIQDQASISPGLLDTLRREMIGVVSRYLEIDSTRIEMGLERKNEIVALAANIPILRVRKEARATDGSAGSRGNVGLETKTENGLESGGKRLEKRYRRPRKRYR